ncbi:TonB-dependent receptor domain-containing protein [Sphingomonas abietis]|uniref:TonB-dependent receptor n=1 Tax=Sphingomonas abietis TaxID=3012344 RepID=A0ABY7NU97_9SPHN|nr:TonB-dependent receptor [Sphingomonas abietis]WBO24016.1 TonB-dependent receptor [Sphingomonas abietis]
MNSRHRLLLAAAALWAPGYAYASSPAAIDLPAGRLGDTIVALSRATGVSIRLSDAALWQRPVRAVHGHLTIERVLHRLLAGTTARAVPIGGDAWQISPAEPAVRPLPAIVHAAAVAQTEIVVSASKRGVRLADFPGTVSVFAGPLFGAAGPDGSDAIANRAASVTSTHLGNGRDKLFIRGVADSGLVGQSQATVGQYFGDLRLSYNAPDPDLKLYDIAAIEVLEGPQGTLYGAGSPGGIIRIVRNDPVPGHFEAAATLGASTVAHGAPGADGSAMLNLPIEDDTVALRLVGYASTDGGYIDDPTIGRKNANRVHTEGGRAVLRIDPGDGWSIRLGGVAQDIHGDDAQYADRDGPPLTRTSAIAQPYDDDYRMAEASIVKTWGDLRFTSANSYVHQAVDERYDATLPGGDPRLFIQDNHTALFTSENRLSHPMTHGISWVVGSSFLHNDARIMRAIGPVAQVSPAAGVVNRIDEGTLYGEVSLQPLRGLTLTGGARLTRSQLAGHALGRSIGLLPADFRGDLGAPTATTATDGPYVTVQDVDEIRQIQHSRSETKLLPSLSASVEPAPGMILFTRFQEGFRPGGLSIGNNLVRRFESDRVSTTEIGVRYDQPGQDAISIAASVAYTDWRDIQADFIDADGLPVTTNIGDGRIWSFDARMAWKPIPSLRLEGSVVVNNSRLTRPDVTQLRFFRLDATADTVQGQLPNVAELGGRVGVDYHHALSDSIDLSASGWARYIGKSRLGVGPVVGGKEGDYVDTGLSVRLAHGPYGMTLSATNLLDTVGNRFALGSPIDVSRSSEITPLQPRTIRIGFDAHF